MSKTDLWRAIWSKKVQVLSLVLASLVFSPMMALAAGGELLKKSDMEYQGAFKMTDDTLGGSRFGYGGRGLAPYRDPDTGKSTLFMEGHAWYPGQVAQLEIPKDFSKSKKYADLPTANVLQNFHDITDGKWATLGTTDYDAIYGMLAYNGRLIIGATSWYDAASKQKTSHGFSSFDLSKKDDFSGFYKLDAVAGPRSLGGYMTPIPSEWQNAFDGPVLTGNAALSIISSISSGPAASVFDPDDLGKKNPVPAKTVVFYPNPTKNYLVSGNSTENTFTFGSSVKGVAFPSGSKSVIFFGRQSMAEHYCYGEGVNDPALHKTKCDPSYPTVDCCYDPCDSSKGGHGYPYENRAWAYDANDLLLVKQKVILSDQNRTANIDDACKNGTEIQPWCVKPYTTWKLDDISQNSCSNMVSAGYDPETSNLYITQDFGESPKVEVYKIKELSSSSSDDSSSDETVGSDDSGSSSKNNDSHKKKKEVTPPRKISNSQKNIGRLSILTQRGKKFSKNSIVQLYFEKPEGGYYAPLAIKTSSTGSFMLTYLVTKPAGTYGWYAVDTKTGKSSRTIYYNVK